MAEPNENETFPAVESRLSGHLRRGEFAGLDPGISLASSDDSESHGAAGAPVPGGPAAGREAGGPRYVRLGELGQGGMGTVYQVLDTDLHRRLALKVIRQPPGEAGGAISDRSRNLLTRFLEEAQVTGQLDHPGIVPLHEIGVDARGCIYFTMRLVKGRHLGEVFKLAKTGEEGWTRDRILPVLMKVCEAMAYAHAKGVVHRDLKPENIMVGRFGEAYVMDWGVAKVRGRVSAAEKEAVAARQSQTFVKTDRSRPDSDSSRRTEAGTVVGTVEFMAPEQARGDIDRIDARSDVYSLGAILYDLLTGQPPYTPADSRVAAHIVLKWVLDGPPKPVRELAPGTPADLAAICEKCMARDPAARYQDMQAVAEDLRAFLRGLPVSANPLGAIHRTRRWCRRNPIASGFLVTLTLGVGIALWSLSNLGTFLVQQSATESAAMEASILEDMNALYSSEVASRVDRAHVTVSHDYATQAGAIPIPATFLTKLGERISANESGVRVHHYSDYPFRSRKDGGPRDEFERAALVSLRANPAQPYFRFEEMDGRQSLRYATARLMKESCVNCHNTHPESTKLDWKTGDVRGVLEIVRPLDRDVERTRAGLRGTLTILGGVALLLVAFGAAIIVVKSRAQEKGALPK